MTPKIELSQDHRNAITLAKADYLAQLSAYDSAIDQANAQIAKHQAISTELTARVQTLLPLAISNTEAAGELAGCERRLAAIGPEIARLKAARDGLKPPSTLELNSALNCVLGYWRVAVLAAVKTAMAPFGMPETFTPLLAHLDCFRRLDIISNVPYPGYRAKRLFQILDAALAGQINLTEPVPDKPATPPSESAQANTNTTATTATET